ncbi:hypothetical protein E6W39_29175 [Kitasatospora acidiphila]|uniref:Uncharacterized protein n=1 Tax=Kitasatospora acidiphila TaxID=2567942 RepID=A0A540W9F9_9ACTN|nr:DUF6093 family protein [Kitasatospora acidiphila]TQF05557.1 hypothetical protein E6W39_29175 [Kitasatospora acidiphila]
MTTPTPMATVDAGGLLPASVAGLVERRLLTDIVRIYRAGAPVLNPDTGQMEPGPDTVIWEGPGAHKPAGGPGLVLRLEGQAYKDDGDSRYILFTPLSAPAAQVGDMVTVVHSDDSAAVGRVWRAMDPGESGTVQVVRSTWMRIEHVASAPGGAS